MTEQEKLNINSRINELISILIQEGNITDCVLFVRGDSEFQNAAFTIKGEAILLSNTIQHHIQHNEEFRKFIFATIGSYLSREPEHEKEFFGGILAIKSNLGFN